MTDIIDCLLYAVRATVVSN